MMGLGVSTFIKEAYKMNPTAKNVNKKDRSIDSL